MLTTGSRFQIPSPPSVRMRLRPLKPFGKQRPGAQPQFEKRRPCVLLLSGRWRPPVQIMPAPLQQALRDSMEGLEMEAIEEEERDC